MVGFLRSRRSDHSVSRKLPNGEFFAVEKAIIDGSVSRNMRKA
jgi:hypothetical protein